MNGIKGVVVFIDDILIAWESDKANLESMEVFRQIEDANFEAEAEEISDFKSSID